MRQIKDMQVERKLNILRRKLMQWENTLYDAELDLELATVLEDTALRSNAQERAKKSMRAIDALSSRLEELETNADKS
jgi:hypothetical protein